MADNFWSIIKGLKKGVAVSIDPNGEGFRNEGQQFYGENIIRNPLVANVTVKKRKIPTPLDTNRPIIRILEVK